MTHDLFGKLKYRERDEQWVGHVRLPLFATVGVRAPQAPLTEEERHTGARRLVRSGTEDDHLAVDGKLAVPDLHLVGRHEQGVRQGPVVPGHLGIRLKERPDLVQGGLPVPGHTTSWHDDPDGGDQLRRDPSPWLRNWRRTN